MTAPERIEITRDEQRLLQDLAARYPVSGLLMTVVVDGRVYLDPASADDDGVYPRWVVLRLAVLRNLDVTSAHLTDVERENLARFAAEHGRELIG